MTAPQESLPQQRPATKRGVGIAAHILAVIFAFIGVIIQLYVPRFVEPLKALGEDPMPFYTAALLRFQHAALVVAALLPLAILFVAWRCRFKAPLPRATVVLIVLATLLEAGTAFALLKPMSGVIVAAEKIKPVGTEPASKP